MLYRSLIYLFIIYMYIFATIFNLFLSYHHRHKMNFNFSVILGLVCSIYSGKMIGNLQLNQGKYYTFHLKNSGKNNFKSV